jgi:hypothetical protein
MNRRSQVFSASVALLVIVNVWRWWPQTDGTPVPLSAPVGVFRPDDFRLKIESEPATGLTSASRDLFRLRLPPPPPVKKVEAPPSPPPPPPKTPEQLAEEAAHAELALIQLVGVVFRGSKGQAFLVKGDQIFMANTGDRVGERFRVESITTDGVLLKDPVTQVSGQIPVSGK